MPDTISAASDTELLAMSLQFHQAITANPTVYGLTAAQATTLGDERADFSAALDAHLTARATALSARELKDAERSDLEAVLRSYRNIAKAHGADEAELVLLGVPTSLSQPSPENATVPSAVVDTSTRLRHKITFVDAAANGNKRKPRGVIGCEIWLKLEGAPPTDNTECVFLTLDTKTPYIAEYDGADGGKLAHYMIRWCLKDGSKSGWGDTVSATITA